MTDPGGGGGFEAGQDGVKIGLHVDIPDDTPGTLHAMAKEAENLRVQLEAITRASADWIEHLTQLPEVANQANQAHRGMASRLGDLWGLQGRDPIKGGQPGAPKGSYVDPFAGQTLGMGDYASALDGQRTGDPRSVVNAANQRGLLGGGEVQATFSDQQLKRLADAILGHEPQPDRPHRPPTPAKVPPPPGHTAGGHPVDEAIQKGTGLAGRIAAEFQPGHEYGSNLGMAREMLGRGEAGLAGMGMGGMGKALGIGGVAVGGVAAANELIQMAGAQIQEYRNIGSIRGGGAKEGFGYEMQARTMALNPFISTDQARQVMQSALSSGYSGKEFDTVTQFMAANLKDMNMDVNTSTHILKKSVEEAGGSIEGLATSLATLKEVSKTGAQTLPDLQKAMSQNVDTATHLGIGGEANSQLAAIFATAFGGEQGPLKGIGPSLFGALDNRNFQLRLGQQANKFGVKIPGGTLPEEIPGLFSDPAQGGSPEKEAMGIQAVLTDQIMPLVPSEGSLEHQGAVFAMHARGTLGWNLDPLQAQQMVKDLRAGKNPIGKAIEQTQGEAGKLEFRAGKGKLTAENASDAAAKVLDNSKNFFKDLVGAHWGDAGKDFLHSGLFGGLAGPALNMGANMLKGKSGADNLTGWHNPILDELINQFGDKGLEIGSGGKWSGLDLGNKQQIQSLTEGNANWRKKGDPGEGRTLAQGKGLSAGDYDKQKVEVYGSVDLKVDQQGKVSAPPRVTLYPAQKRGNVGWGPSTPNNPDPGEPHR